MIIIIVPVVIIVIIIKIIIDIICILVFRITFQNRTVHCINGVIVLYSIPEELNLIFQPSIIIIKLCLGERHVCHFQSCMPGSGFFCFIKADGARCRRLSRRFYFCLCFLLWLLLYFRLCFLLWLLLYFRLRFLLGLTGLLWLATLKASVAPSISVTRRDTSFRVSRNRRSRSWREVTNLPSRPA